MACIYRIRNLVNSNTYIGSTKKVFKRRVSEHLSELRNNKHYNKHLQNAWNLYGEDAFQFEQIELVNIPENLSDPYKNKFLRKRELEWINILNPAYNIDKVTERGSFGRKLTDEEKEKIRKHSTGRKHTPEAIKRIKEARAKQIITEEHKNNISRGLKNSKVIRKKPISKSKETRIKHSESLKKNYISKSGAYNPEAQKRRIEKMKIHYNTPEMRLVLKKAARDRNRKSFTCFSKNGDFVGEFTSQIEAAEVLGFLKPWGISSVLNNIQKSHAGYIFKYKD